MKTNATHYLEKIIGQDHSLLSWLLLIRVVKKIGRDLDKLAHNAGLGRAQFLLLAIINLDEGLQQQEYAERLGVTKGNICQLADKLEESSYIVRQKEGRSNYLSLSDTGRELISKLVPNHDLLVKERLSVLSPEELQQLYTLLCKIDREMD